MRLTGSEPALSDEASGAARLPNRVQRCSKSCDYVRAAQRKQGMYNVANGLPEAFPPQLIALARGLKDPSSQLAWQYPTILEVVTALAARGNAILGGDVMYDVEGWGLDYYHDGVYCGSWSLNWKGKGAWEDYVAESVAVTIRYVEAYVRRNGGDYWYVPVFTDEESYRVLQAYKA